jgi:hypothetical protein
MLLRFASGGTLRKFFRSQGRLLELKAYCCPASSEIGPERNREFTGGGPGSVRCRGHLGVPAAAVV